MAPTQVGPTIFEVAVDESERDNKKADETITLDAPPEIECCQVENPAPATLKLALANMRGRGTCTRPQRLGLIRSRML